MQWAFLANDKVIIFYLFFFFFFFQKTDFVITCKFVSAGDNLHEILKSIFWENK